MPIKVELSSLKMLPRSEKNGKELLKLCNLDLERLALSRDDAMEHYAKQAEERKKKFNANLPPKNITLGSLVLRYNNKFDYNKGDKFAPHWEGVFKVLEKFDNGSYQLIDASGAWHRTRVNGRQLKPYFSYVLEE